MGSEQGRILRDAIRTAVAAGLARPEVVAARTFAGPVRALLPPAAEEELQGIASAAGVSADDLFLLEVAREGRRWHSEHPALVEASFVAAPGPGSPLWIGFAGLSADPAMGEHLLVVERHPVEGVATLCLSTVGALGGLLGASSKGLVAAVAEVEVEPERRSIKGLPMTIALRLALQTASSPKELLGRLPGLSGHRVVAGGADGTRLVGLLSVVTEEPKSFPSAEWVMVEAGPAAPSNPRTHALASHLLARRLPPRPEDAHDLAVVARAPADDDPVVDLTASGFSLRFPDGAATAYPWVQSAEARAKSRAGK